MLNEAMENKKEAQPQIASKVSGLVDVLDATEEKTFRQVCNRIERNDEFRRRYIWSLTSDIVEMMMPQELEVGLEITRRATKMLCDKNDYSAAYLPLEHVGRLLIVRNFFMPAVELFGEAIKRAIDIYD